MYIGAHINRNGTLINTIKTIQKDNGNALQLFVSNPRSSELVNLENYKSLGIKEYCDQNDFKLVIHSPYTINLAKETKINKRSVDLQDCYWVNILINQLIASDIIGSVGVVVHVGKHTTNNKEDGTMYMYKAIQYVIQSIKELGLKSKLILETPAGAGTELLCNINEFIKFYNTFTKSEKKHLGICLDTAHIWSSGYDINEYYKIIEESNSDDIMIVHLNNSKKEKGSNVDVHETLFEGKIEVDEIALFVRNLNKKVIVILEKPGDLQKEFVFIRENHQ